MTRWIGSRTYGRKSVPDMAGKAARALPLIRAIPADIHSDFVNSRTRHVA